MYVQYKFLYENCIFFFQAEDGIRDAQESRGLGDVYKRQSHMSKKTSEQDVSILDNYLYL